MFKNEMIKMIVDLQKKGIHIHLTEEGYDEFIKLLQKEFPQDDTLSEVG
jgi:hypothetical protein